VLEPILDGIGHCPSCPIGEGLSKRREGEVCID
jgi:hypothetical protein